jgi:hypothetical protein
MFHEGSIHYCAVCELVKASNCSPNVLSIVSKIINTFSSGISVSITFGAILKVENEKTKNFPFEVRHNFLHSIRHFTVAQHSRKSRVGLLKDD